MSLRRIILGCLMLAGVTLTRAGGWSASGFAGVELRGFWDDAAYPGQREGVQSSLVARPELDWRSGSGRSLISVVPFLRYDAWDSERTHLDLREAYWSRRWDDWELLVGLNTVFWGVAESRHLVNVINQVDFVEDIDREDWLGQPMIQVATQQSWGRLDLFALPGFREMTWPGEDGRLRPPLPVDSDRSIFESDAGRERLDGAVRWSHFIGDWDVGASVFHGNGREPRLVQVVPTDLFLTPIYDVITQVGADVQYTRGAWLYKLEAIGRRGQGRTFGATVAGLEYTLYQVNGTGADIGMLVEYLHDGRDDGAPWTIFDNDLFIGTRLALNDIQDTAILAGAVVDLHDGSTVALVEAERRIGQRFTLELEARWFTRVEPGNTVAFFRQDSYLMTRFSYHF